ncbi:unnamed protein product [Linum trigynum]|uniref:DUF4283 domain-containing protein n=1 Tax=Linum trigynum TaxID=586398 RepID=A0AAV2GE47_9ROSI
MGWSKLGHPCKAFERSPQNHPTHLLFAWLNSAVESSRKKNFGCKENLQERKKEKKKKRKPLPSPLFVTSGSEVTAEVRFAITGRTGRRGPPEAAVDSMGLFKPFLEALDGWASHSLSGFLLTLNLCVVNSDSALPRSMAAGNVLLFGDEDVAPGAERNDLSLLGRIIGPSPPLRHLLTTLRGLWGCDGPISVLPAAEGLLQIVFPNEGDLNRVLKMGPWILPKFMINLAPWVAITSDVAEQMWRVPLYLQFWDVPTACCSQRMATLLGG